MTNEDIMAMHERESGPIDPDHQEALSRRYSDAAVILIRLRSGRFAVYNAIREFCGLADTLDGWPPKCWRAPQSAPPKAAPRKTVDLSDLGLI